MRVTMLQMGFYGLVSACLAVALLAGCGSSSSTAAANASKPAPAAITGLATPSTVSVVTATNVP